MNKTSYSKLSWAAAAALAGSLLTLPVAQAVIVTTAPVTATVALADLDWAINNNNTPGNPLDDSIGSVKTLSLPKFDPINGALLKVELTVVDFSGAASLGLENQDTAAAAGSWQTIVGFNLYPATGALPTGATLLSVTGSTPLINLSLGANDNVANFPNDVDFDGLPDGGVIGTDGYRSKQNIATPGLPTTKTYDTGLGDDVSGFLVSPGSTTISYYGTTSSGLDVQGADNANIQFTSRGTVTIQIVYTYDQQVPDCVPGVNEPVEWAAIPTANWPLTTVQVGSCLNLSAADALAILNQTGTDIRLSLLKEIIAAILNTSKPCNDQCIVAKLTDAVALYCQNKDVYCLTTTVKTQMQALLKALRDYNISGDCTPLCESAGTATIGYWKNHPEAWPVTSITLGCKTYTKAEAICLLGTPSSDPRVLLAKQLIAAKLNVHPSLCNENCVEADITRADELLCLYAGNYCYIPNSAKCEMLAIKTKLDDYNNGRLCEHHRDDGKCTPTVVCDPYHTPNTSCTTKNKTYCSPSKGYIKKSCR